MSDTRAEAAELVRAWYQDDGYQANYMTPLIERIAAALSARDAEVERLRTALKPFAEIGKEMEGSLKDKAVYAMVGDCLQAREALERRQDGGTRADNVKHLGGPHMGGA